jgi:hypothetical protein
MATARLGTVQTRLRKTSPLGTTRNHSPGGCRLNTPRNSRGRSRALGRHVEDDDKDDYDYDAAATRFLAPRFQLLLLIEDKLDPTTDFVVSLVSLAPT